MVLNHPDYLGLSGNAVKLLVQLAYQYRGKNNGDLTVSWSVMRKRGFRAKETLAKVTRELLEAGMITRTRTGRFLNPGGVCALYALTWEPIDDCPGKQLEVAPTIRPPRQFSMETSKKPGPEISPGSAYKIGRARTRDKAGRYSSS